MRSVGKKSGLQIIRSNFRSFNRALTRSIEDSDSAATSLRNRVASALLISASFSITKTLAISLLI